MSWLDPQWQYHPAATHGDSQAFAQRQRERAKAYEYTPLTTEDVYRALYGDSVKGKKLKQVLREVKS